MAMQSLELLRAEVVDVSSIDMARRMKFLCHLIQIVAGDTQQPNHLLHLRNFQLNHIAIDGHFADISAHVGCSEDFHLLPDQRLLFRRRPDLDLLCSRTIHVNHPLK